MKQMANHSLRRISVNCTFNRWCLAEAMKSHV